MCVTCAYGWRVACKATLSMMASNRLGNLKTGDEFVVKSLNKEEALEPPTVLDPIRPVKVRQELAARVQQQPPQAAVVRPAPQSGVQLAAAQPAQSPRELPIVSAPPATAEDEPRGSRLPWAIAAIAVGVLLGVGASAFLSKRHAAATPSATSEPAQPATQAQPQANAPHDDGPIVFGGKIQRQDTPAAPATAEAKTPAVPEAKPPAAPAPEPKPVAAAPEKTAEPKAQPQPAPQPKPAPVAKAEPRAAAAQPEAPKPEAPKPAAPTAKADAKPAAPGKPKGGNDVEAAARDAELLKKQLAETIP